MNVHFSSATVEWPTPKAVYDRLNQEFGFDLDPCPIDGTENGLATLLMPWRGRRVFCNPPYGPEIRNWLQRADEAELAVYLIPARTDTRWFHEIVLPKSREIRFIKGRLKFGDAKNSAPFPSMIVIFWRSVMPDKPRTRKENSEMMEVNVSELSPAEIGVSDALIEAHNRMWAIGPKRRKNIYHRWEMLRLFTPEMSRLFEQNLRRINNRGGE